MGATALSKSNAPRLSQKVWSVVLNCAVAGIEALDWTSCLVVASAQTTVMSAIASLTP